MSYYKIEWNFDDVLIKKNIDIPDKVKSLPINTLNFSQRTFNALTNKNIESIGDLLGCKLVQLKSFPNLGKKSVIEIFNALNSIDDSSFYTIHSFGFSKNTIEILDKFGIENVDELNNFDWNSLLTIPYYGKKAVKEISELMELYNENTPHELNPKNKILEETTEILDLELNKKILLDKLEIKTINDFLQYDFEDTLLDENDGNYFQYIKRGLFQKIDSGSSFRAISDFVCGLDPLKNKDKDRYTALKLRLRGDITLEAAGERVKVTRERIRQIEVKALKKLINYLPEIHVELLLTKIFIHEPMYLDMLAIKNIYFEGIKEYLDNDGSFIKAIFDHKYSHLQFEKVNDSIIISKKGLTVDEVVSEIENNNIKPDLVNDYISLLGRSDAKELILQKLEANKPKSKRGRVHLAIKEIFDESKELLQMREIAELIKEKYKIDAHSNVINDAISKNKEIYLFGKNGWGHEKHFRKLDNKQLGMIIPELIEILILSKDTQRGRVGLLAELKKNVKEKSFYINDLVQNLSPHDIDWILRKETNNYSKLQNLGRGNWLWSKKSEERITMSHAALKVLEEAGKPLTAKELEERVIGLRGHSNSQFQVRTNRNRPELIQLEKEIHGQGKHTMWGLRDRDLPISQEQQNMLFDLICAKLKEGKKYIELDELENMIHMCAFDQNISTLQIIRMLFVYTANADKDNEYFSINFSRKRIPLQGFFKLENRIKFSHKDFE